MPTDALITLQTSTTKTSTFRGTAITLAGGTPRRGNVARVIYSAASNASGSNTVVFSIDRSDDGGSTWITDFQADPITLSTSAQSGEIFIPYHVVAKTQASNAPQVALACTISGGGSGPTITYTGEHVSAGPM